MGLQIINFHCFQSYQQITQKIQKKIQFTHRKIPLRGIFMYVFGIFSEIPYMLYVVINIFLLIIVLYILIKLFFENDRLLIPLSLIAGGGIGNVFERFLYHGVTDFIDLYYKSYHWPAFNFADLFISSGIIIFILFNLKENSNCSQA